MRPTGAAARSGERSNSYNKRPSPASRVPADYKPPHLRTNYTGGTNLANRVSPGAPRLGAQRQSPNTRVYGQNKQSVSPGTRPSNYGQNKPSPGIGGISNLAGNVRLNRAPPGVKVAPG